MTDARPDPDEILFRLRQEEARAARQAEDLLRRLGRRRQDQAMLSAARTLRDEGVDVVIGVTPIEYRLLAHLAAHPHCVLTHRQLLQAVWGPGHTEDSHYLRVYMAQLRKKIEGGPAKPVHLVTETGIGYRFVP